MNLGDSIRESLTPEPWLVLVDSCCSTIFLGQDQPNPHLEYEVIQQ